MRIQDTNDILNEARVQRLDAQRHLEPEVSMWDRVKVAVPQLLRRKNVQAGLITVGTALVTAGLGMLASPRARRNTFSRTK